MEPLEKAPRMSRIVWRKQVKKQRRKRNRQRIAKEVALKEQQKLEVLKRDPVYLVRQAELKALELMREEEEQRISAENHRLWIEREQLAQFEFQKTKKIREEAHRVEQEKRELKQKRLEEAEAKRRLQKEQKQKAMEDIRLNHERKLQEIRDFIDGVSVDVPESLKGVLETLPSTEPCQYYKKTSVCRFGERCTKNHLISKYSSVLLIPYFFRSEALLKAESLTNSHDIIQNSLEVNRDFNEFFEDICLEFESYGVLQNVVVCSNSQKHMLGNAYVEFESPKSALTACFRLNGRFYGGQKLVIKFCHNFNWKTAVCGLALNNKCTKGGSCNYLHIFKNPGGRYPLKMNLNYAAEVTETPGTTQHSLNAEKEEMHMSWNEPSRDPTNARNWRWSASPEPKEQISSKISNMSHKTQNEKMLSPKRERSVSRLRFDHESRLNHRRSPRSRTPSRSHRGTEESRDRKKKRKRSKSRHRSRSRSRDGNHQRSKHRGDNRS